MPGLNGLISEPIDLLDLITTLDDVRLRLAVYRNRAKMQNSIGGELDLYVAAPSEIKLQRELNLSRITRRNGVAEDGLAVRACLT